MSVGPRYARSLAYIALMMVYALVVTACSESGVPDAEQLIDDTLGTEPLPWALQQLQKDTTLLSAVPEVAHTRIMANSGIQIAFTERSLIALAPAAVIEKQWVYMQKCLQLVGVAPIVLVRDGPIAPFTLSDDVVRNETLIAQDIASVPIASASTLYGPVIQVSITDFDGSLGSPSFNLRSIMGRYLWLSANLPERDYPFACARQEP
ncbi:MAG: hypothetical protein AB8B87_02685 [Granulosicoccus sp.]